MFPIWHARAQDRCAGPAQDGASPCPSSPSRSPPRHGPPPPGLEATLASAAADLSTRLLRKRPELTAVVVERVDPAAWFAGGASLEAQGKSSFWLEIKVVDGTNTKDEKEAFVAAAFDRFGAVLGDLHPESYVHVDEVSADAYGFGGLTQERRHVAAKLGVPPTARERA